MVDVAFGQYYPTDSFIHKMDSRIKILLLIAYIVMIFIAKNFFGFAVAGIFLLACILIAKLPFLKVIKSVKAVLFIVVFTSIINVFTHHDESSKVLVQWGALKISDTSIIFACFLALRISLLVFGSCLLTLTTSPVQLTDGIESLLMPLKLIKFPVHELALIMSIALRFIPTIMEETNRIINAQKARGADFDSGNIFKRAKAMMPIIIPLLISSLRRAEELGDALDSRCYSDSKKRTKYKKAKITLRDVIGVIFVTCFILGVVYLNGFGVSII